MADKNVSIDITAADKTKAAFESVKKGLGDVAGSAEKVRGVFSGFAAIGAAVGITDLMKEAVAAASIAEQSSNRLNAVMRATGDTSGYTREQLDRMADSLAKATTFDDDGIRDAQANLMKFGRLHGETFEHALKLSADYAAFTGGSMVDATQAIGKALSDPVNGVTALEKAFGHLSQSQREAIEKFTSMGDIAHAQEIIFQKLESAIGGTAGAMNTGLYGATTAATKAWDDMLKALGRTGPVKVTVESTLGVMANIMNDIANAIAKQNNELAKNPLFNGGKLPALPEAFGGRPRSNVMTKEDGSPMTVEDAGAAGRAAAAQRAEQAQARMEAQKKLLKELQPLADELAHSYMMAEIKQKEAAQNMTDDFIKDQLQEKLEFEQLASELSRSAVDAETRQREAAAELDFAFQEDRRQRLGIFNDQEKEEKLLAIMDSMRSQAEIEDEDWIAKRAILDERAALDYEHAEYWIKKKFFLEKQHDQKVLAIESQKNAAVQAMQFQTAQMGIDLLGQVVGKSKAAAIFMIALHKGLAIAQTIQATSVAVMRCFSDLGPVLGAPVAATIEALGATQVGIIAASGLVEAAHASGGGGSASIGTFPADPTTGFPVTSNDLTVQQVAQAQQAQLTQRKDVFIQILGEGMFSAADIRDKLIPLLNDAVGDGVTLHATAI